MIRLHQILSLRIVQGLYLSKLSPCKCLNDSAGVYPSKHRRILLVCIKYIEDSTNQIETLKNTDLKSKHNRVK
jgi:hypothetical protein